MGWSDITRAFFNFAFSYLKLYRPSWGDSVKGILRYSLKALHTSRIFKKSICF